MGYNNITNLNFMNENKINLISVDMGYGHQRAAYPLLDLSGGESLTMNKYDGISAWEEKYWASNLKSYEMISRFKKVPILGDLVFSIMDYFQRILQFYPFRDLSKTTFQQKFFYRSIKGGLGNNLVNKLNENCLPLVSTFFVAAQAAEYHKYLGDIYCVVCDADASRAWAPLCPKESKIQYFLPNENLKKRFLMYGLPEKNLIVTGFPLPKEVIGENKEILKSDLFARLKNLDPEKKYQHKYEGLIKDVLLNVDVKEDRPLTITFAVGGAGAQKEIGAIIISKLSQQIKDKKIIINLVAGNRSEVKDYFIDKIKSENINFGVNVIYSPNKNDYFKEFNQVLRVTDILWTKPSELSFYCALGLPIIISNTIGSQEDFNREWLISIGGGVDSPNPEYVHEWLFDLIASGKLARAAIDGYLNAEQMGAYNIEKIINNKL